MTTPKRLTPAQRDAAIQALERARHRWTSTYKLYEARMRPILGGSPAARAHRLVVKRIAARLRALRGEEERE